MPTKTNHTNHTQPNSFRVNLQLNLFPPPQIQFNSLFRFFLKIKYPHEKEGVTHS